MLVEEVVLLIAFAVTEIKRLLFIDSMIDSIKVREYDKVNMWTAQSLKLYGWKNEMPLMVDTVSDRNVVMVSSFYNTGSTYQM